MQSRISSLICARSARNVDFFFNFFFFCHMLAKATKDKHEDFQLSQHLSAHAPLGSLSATVTPRSRG